MKAKKLLLSSLLVLPLIVTLTSFNYGANTEVKKAQDSSKLTIGGTFTKDGFTYTIFSDKSVSISDYDNSKENILISDEVVYNDYHFKINKIDNYAFEGCNKLKSVEINSDFISIGNTAFEDCYNITNFEVHSKFAHIDLFAIAGLSSLKTLSLKDCSLGECLPNTLREFSYDSALPFNGSVTQHSYNLEKLVLGPKVTDVNVWGSSPYIESLYLQNIEVYLDCDSYTYYENLGTMFSKVYVEVGLTELETILEGGVDNSQLYVYVLNDLGSEIYYKENGEYVLYSKK